MGFIKSRIAQATPVPNTLGGAGGACTLSVGAIWEQLIVEAEYRNPNYDFSTLFENVVWGNTQMFFPISLVMIGSWLIDRESTMIR